MKRLIRRRPSPATAIALVALFVALGGSAYAAAKITGRDVVDRSLTYHDIAFNSIGPGEVANLTGHDVRQSSMGGWQVDETTLGKVPSAGAADTAGGLTPKKFLVKLAPTNTEQTVVQAGSLTILGTCSSTGVPTLRATSSVPDAELISSNTDTSNKAAGTRSCDLDPGESVAIDEGHSAGSGVVTYATPTGEVATVTLGFARAPTLGGTNTGCAVFGTALNG